MGRVWRNARLERLRGSKAVFVSFAGGGLQPPPPAPPGRPRSAFGTEVLVFRVLTSARATCKLFCTNALK